MTQYSYWSNGLLNCTAQRLNPSTYGSLPGACTAATAGSAGADRISYNYYYANNALWYTISAFGSSADSTQHYAYTNNGKLSAVQDGNGNQTSLTYDGLDRLITTTYADGSAQHLSYDANGNAVSFTPRGGSAISLAYDARNNQSTAANGASITYDNLNRATTAVLAGVTTSFGYDALSRKTSETGPLGTVSYAYVPSGVMTQMTWPDGFHVAYNYDWTNALSSIQDNSGNTLASYSYDNLGNRSTVTRANGATTSYSYDALSRLTSLAHSLAGSASQTYGFSYDAAGEITDKSETNSAYDWLGAYAVNRSYSANNLNQLTTSGSLSLSYDGRGNLSYDGANSYGYDATNHLTAFNASASLAYDGAGRLITTAGSATTNFLYDGDQVIAEYDNSGHVLRRYVPTRGENEPVVWYEGSGFTDRRFLIPDERGSIIAVTDSAANVMGSGPNTYDEYGVPGSSNLGRFQYTGQMYIPETGMYDYKARAYSPTLGRFMQTDPIGYGDGVNWYSYAHNNPINGVDPTGTSSADYGDSDDDSPPPSECTGGEGAEACQPLAPTASGGCSPTNVCITAHLSAPLPAVSGLGGGQQVFYQNPSIFVLPPTPQSPPISCSSRLPDGSTVGAKVRQLNGMINQADNEGNILSGAATFFQGVATGGILDFKNTFSGAARNGYSGSYLAAAGNFAYGAASSNYFGNSAVGNQIAYAGGSGYALSHGKANVVTPGTIFPQDASGAANIPAGLKSGGC